MIRLIALLALSSAGITTGFSHAQSNDGFFSGQEMAWLISNALPDTEATNCRDELQQLAAAGPEIDADCFTIEGGRDEARTQIDGFFDGFHDVTQIGNWGRDTRLPNDVAGETVRWYQIQETGQTFVVGIHPPRWFWQGRSTINVVVVDTR